MQQFRFNVVGILLLVGFIVQHSFAETRPNVLWFVVDDMCADFSCYGQKLIQTPNVDALAKDGVLFENAHVTAPVCSINRTAFITGMYQYAIGGHHHRSDYGPLPQQIKTLPQIFKSAGYYTCNGGPHTRNNKIGKTDYNFTWKGLYDSNDWEGRTEGQPFFMQVQLRGGKLRGNGQLRTQQELAKKVREIFGKSTDSKSVTLPPYYPNDPIFMNDWAAYLDSATMTDHVVGQYLERLKKEGLYKNTIIIFMTDHGISHARGKQFNYHEGTHIPFIVKGPGLKKGERRSDLIEHIDMGPITLALTGLEIPKIMQGKDVFSPSYQQRKAVFCARDRCDETIDMIRSIRTEKYLYIRNYYPYRPHLQPSRYKDGKVIVKRLREMHSDKTLPKDSEKILMQLHRPFEELYDIQADPYSMNNLAKSEPHQQTLRELRQQLNQHLVEVRDAGFIPEPTMDLLSKKQAVYLTLQDKSYPIQELVRIANMAADGKLSDLNKFIEALKHNNPAMRFWALEGLRNCSSDSPQVKQACQKHLSDPDPSVRISAMKAIAALGEKQKAIELLLKEAKETESDAHANWALDAIKFLDVPEVIEPYTEKDLVHGRYSGRSYDFLTKKGTVFKGK